MAKYYYKLDEMERIGMTAPVSFGVPAEEDIFDFPEDFNFSKQYDYKIVDGQLVHDPVPEEATPADDAVTWDALAAAIREGVNAV